MKAPLARLYIYTISYWPPFKSDKLESLVLTSGKALL